MDKVALVTGASRGIGKGAALTLADMGYRLILVATNEKTLREVADFITKKHRLTKAAEPLVFALDVADAEQVNKALAQALKKTKRIDVLVNAAGIYRAGTSEMVNEEFWEMLKVNLLGCFNFIQAIVPSMKKQRSGYIFNIASKAGKTASFFSGGYAASKFGLVGLNESLGTELAEHGIKATAICPSYVDTDMAARSPLTDAEKIPVEDISKTIRFLLSLSSSGCVKEVVIDCRKMLEFARAATGR